MLDDKRTTNFQWLQNVTNQTKYTTSVDPRAVTTRVKHTENPEYVPKIAVRVASVRHLMLDTKVNANFIKFVKLNSKLTFIHLSNFESSFGSKLFLNLEEHLIKHQETTFLKLEKIDWSRWDSNPHLSDNKSDVLPIKLLPRIIVRQQEE